MWLMIAGATCVLIAPKTDRYGITTLVELAVVH